MKECNKRFGGRDFRSKGFYEVGWRNALEWAKSQREMGHTVNKRYVIPVEAIKQELEGN